MALLATLALAAPLLIAPSHPHPTGDGCDIPGANAASWGCGTASIRVTGNRTVIDLTHEDVITDGYCVTAWAQASNGAVAQVDRNCTTGRVERHTADVAALGLRDVRRVCIYRSNGGLGGRWFTAYGPPNQCP